MSSSSPKPTNGRGQILLVINSGTAQVGLQDLLGHARAGAPHKATLEMMKWGRGSDTASYFQRGIGSSMDILLPADLQIPLLW